MAVYDESEPEDDTVPQNRSIDNTEQIEDSSRMCKMKNRPQSALRTIP